eukprot:7161677-Pyramimonas_sp.AAC.1
MPVDSAECRAEGPSPRPHRDQPEGSHPRATPSGFAGATAARLRARPSWAHPRCRRSLPWSSANVRQDAQPAQLALAILRYPDDRPGRPHLMA